MASELGVEFDIDDALRIGTIPLVHGSPDREDALRAYAALYMTEEVKAEGMVRSIGGFSRFLEFVALSHGSVLNISNIARESEVGRKAVEGYVRILEDLMVAFRLAPFLRRSRKALAARPKFYLFDTGVFRILRPTGPLDDPGGVEGPALEGLVAQHLRAWIDYTSAGDRLFFWRTRAGTEVDFVVYGPSGFRAIEVKSARKIRRADLRPLRSFGEDYPEAALLFLYRGDETLVIDGIRCMPAEVFLAGLRPGAFGPENLGGGKG